MPNNNNFSIKLHLKIGYILPSFFRSFLIDTYRILEDAKMQRFASANALEKQGAKFDGGETSMSITCYKNYIFETVNPPSIWNIMSPHSIKKGTK